METMHDHDHLASFADILAGELPGAWSTTHLSAEDRAELAALTDRVWDPDLFAETVSLYTVDHGACLTRTDDGVRLIVVDHYAEQEGFIVATIAPEEVPAEAFRGVREPDSVHVPDDPFLAARAVTTRLLPRYERALAQVRSNAAQLSRSQPDRVVLTWKPDGSLTTTATTSRVADLLAAHGFAHDEKSGTYRLSGEDTAAQAKSIREVGAQLARLGVGVVLQHPASSRTPPPATVPAAAQRPSAGTPATRLH
ncbi:hypothetical protein ABZ569_10705 [Streptomyces albus]|uniref:hypothetical protein n=1 Tax=Streptomyces albus TaxID=1888 RepID=UPI003403754A